ncbi:uncharacterized mitochondrial protein AtMg00860-like, partial [Anneissia japonica]|uniref:uncharacterized mitochondrial protein AtMg00860-like n=1 Tax=Anneissia japonica TaxID=1529436 RepID=UPI00142593AF
MVFSEAGIELDPKKVEAIVSMKAPCNVSEVRSLLGMTNYCARFIPNYSTITAPIRQLTHKDKVFTWHKKQQSAFDEIKKILSSSPVVSYFDVTKVTELIVDASPVGLAGILVQYETKEGSKKPQVVAYGSRALTP